MAKSKLDNWTPVYTNAEPVFLRGKIIGEVYNVKIRTDDDDSWGYLSYIKDDGGDGLETKAGATQCLIEDHNSQIAEMKKTQSDLSKELSKWT